MDETREIPAQSTSQLPRVVAVRSARRVVLGLLGAILILLGVAAFILPVIPGAIPLILLGLTVLSWEFDWAKRLLVRFKRRWREFSQKRRRRS